MTFSIEVENKFEMSPRDIHIRRKSRETTMEEHMASCPGYVSGNIEEKRSIVSLPLGADAGEGDYLEISVDNQQVNLGPCRIDIWSNVPFTFIPPGTAAISIIPSEDGETNTSLKIPSGLPTWKLEIMRPISIALPRDEDSEGMTNVTVGDDEPGTGDSVSI